MKKSILSFALVICLSLNVWALPYTGELSISDNTLVSNPFAPWPGATLSWVVNFIGGYWVYDYTFSVSSKGISHEIFEVSDTFTNDNIIEGTTKYTKDGTEYPVLDEFSPDDPGNSNPGLPGNLYGLKWDTIGTDVLSYNIIIKTDRNPMWGDFYAKDRVINPGQYNVYVYNSKFGIDPGNTPIGDGNAGGWALVPDTTTVPPPLPEPSTLLLLGMGLVGMGIGTRRLRRK